MATDYDAQIADAEARRDSIDDEVEQLLTQLGRFSSAGPGLHEKKWAELRSLRMRYALARVEVALWANAALSFKIFKQIKRDDD